MSFNLPFTALSLLHKHYTHLVSSNDDKFDFVDSNKIPYSIKYNKEIPNYFIVADENGFVKIFTTYPKLKQIKEFSVQKSCIYDLQWLNSHEIACGGGDQTVSVYDMNTCTRLAVLKGHTESVKSIAIIPNNPFMIASGARDGAVLIFDTRFNRHQSDDPLDTVSSIKAVNSIQIAHFIDSNPTNSITNNSFVNKSNNRSTIHSNVLKSKSFSLNQSQTASSKRPGPVACVSFQSDNLLVSAGATDGLIKVWDIRKIYSSSSARKHVEPLPLHVFDNHLNEQPVKLPSKGYSNLVFNTSRTHLYANCLNGQLYEYNFSTYNQNHTRSLSSCSKMDENQKLKLSHHTNQSNFIKSSLSQCENFILTGSSDFNAYIYSTNMNSSSNEFKKQMPVIVLKGHTNEVTTVDWNPFDSNQLITCSDDNTLRVWNVKRDLDLIKSNECNFSTAETITCDDLATKKYVSTIRNHNRYYTKYMPNVTGIYDEHLFVNYDYKNFMKFQSNCIEMQVDTDLENELCIKCQNISIDKEHELSSSSSSTTTSPVSKNIKSIENELIRFKAANEFNFINLETPLSNLPINIISQDEIKVTIDEVSLNMKRQPSSSALITSANSFSLLLNENKSKTKSLKRKATKPAIASPQTKLKPNESACASATPLRMLLKNPISTSKKRSWDASDQEKDLNTMSEARVDEPKTPKIKRRLLMGVESMTQSPNAATSSPKPSKTILNYFSPIQPK